MLKISFSARSLMDIFMKVAMQVADFVPTNFVPENIVAPVPCIKIFYRCARSARAPLCVEYFMALSICNITFVVFVLGDERWNFKSYRAYFRRCCKLIFISYILIALVVSYLYYSFFQ